MAAFLTLLISSVLSLGGVCGISLSQQPILTLKAKNGQVYDCVNFYKQPAFNHPSLKNQNFKVRRPLQEAERRAKGIGLEHGGCPIGSVPILRVNNTILSTGQRCVVVIQTNMDDSNRKFYGSDAAMTLHKPIVQQDQWSSSRIKLSNGQDNVEAGWMVNPTIFKDNEAHLYAKYEAGGSGCVNVECPGFVQVSKDFALGVIPEQYSIVGKGEKFTWNISIEKHSDDGHWWVTITDGNDRYGIGYWPKNIFTSLAEVANQVEWGGEINNPSNKFPVPDMGDSHKAVYDTWYSAFFMRVTVNTEDGNYIEPKATQKLFDCSQFYTVLDQGYQGDYWGRIMYYGGGDH